MTKNPKEVDWSLFESQEKEISTINNELYSLRKEKYPEYRDSYYRYYNEFGMRGMIGDLYRKFDRLKIMSESYTDEDIKNKEKEITDQFYDIISYCQLQLYWLRKEKWARKPNKIPVKIQNYWNETDSRSFEPIISPSIKSTIKTLYPIPGTSVRIIVTGSLGINGLSDESLFKLISDKIIESMGR